MLHEFILIVYKLLIVNLLFQKILNQDINLLMDIQFYKFQKT